MPRPVAKSGERRDGARRGCCSYGCLIKWLRKDRREAVFLLHLDDHVAVHESAYGP
jgi:hypothetical protein